MWCCSQPVPLASSAAPCLSSMQCAGLGTHDSHAYSSQQVSCDGACAGPLAEHAVVKAAGAGGHDVRVHVPAAGPAPGAPLEVLWMEALRQHLGSHASASHSTMQPTGGSGLGMTASCMKGSYLQSSQPPAQRRRASQRNALQLVTVDFSCTLYCAMLHFSGCSYQT